MEVSKIHLNKYDVDVNQYLGYDEIQFIIESTLPIENYNDRIKNIDMLVLHYAAGIPIETLESADPDEYLCSGLIDAVECAVENFCEIKKGLDYYNSTPKLLNAVIQAIQKLPETPEFKELIEGGIRN